MRDDRIGSDISMTRNTSVVQNAYAHIAARSHLIKYAVFAALAIAVNIFSQSTALILFGAYWFGIYIAIAAGNGAGLVFKYIVDKYWVFEDVDVSIAGNSRKFALYAAFGIGTTMLFWIVELVFHYTFNSVFMTNVGGVFGLSIGYVLKYNLDKHYTFARKSACAS